MKNLCLRRKLGVGVANELEIRGGVGVVYLHVRGDAKGPAEGGRDIYRDRGRGRGSGRG